MEYPDTQIALFLKRPNRFVAHVRLLSKEEQARLEQWAQDHPDAKIEECWFDQEEKGEVVHVKNTGRCQELLIPGRLVSLAPASNPQRKTRFDLVAVYKPGRGWVNIDSQVCNHVFAAWLDEQPQITYRREVKYGHSRFDFLLNDSIFCEVKGCTLEMEGQGYFPDAPTERGKKHVEELTKMALDGKEVWLVFVIAINGVASCLPCFQIDPAFGDALHKAKESGLRIFYGLCHVEKNSIRLMEMIPENGKDA